MGIQKVYKKCESALEFFLMWDLKGGVVQKVRNKLRTTSLRPHQLSHLFNRRGVVVTTQHHT